MKLGVATICPHIRYRGQWWSYEPFVLEVDAWAGLFEQLIMVAPYEEGPPPAHWSPYEHSDSIKVIPYRRGKGRGLDQERTSILEMPSMIAALVKAARQVDAFHVRCPGSIGLVSALAVPLISRRMFAKYAGQWNGYRGEAATVRLQRAILGSPWWRGPVTVYGEWPRQPRHVVPFFTSVMTDEQMERAKAASKLRFAGKEDSPQLRVLFIGRLTEAKRVNLVLNAVATLLREGIEVQCKIVGDGPQREALQAQAASLRLESCVQFVGALGFDKVLEIYEQSDVLVLVSESEGWPKVIAEAMAFGMVCIGVQTGMVPQMLGQGRGIAITPGSDVKLAGALRVLANDPEARREMGQKAAAWAQHYTLDGLREALSDMLARWWSVKLDEQTESRHPEN